MDEVRLFTPRKGQNGPLREVIVDRIADTGGGWYRPPFRTQNPANDPQEPSGGESSDAGYDHGWANCTMSAGAMVLAFHTLGAQDKWGGHLRHKQSDQSGGTDLYDLKEAWGAYGETLSIRSGNGWSGVQADRNAGRAIVLQGEGGTPGAGTYTGGHAIAVMPEPKSDGKWLIGNPECTGYEWVTESALREWAEDWSSSVAWARSDAHKPGGSTDVSGVDVHITDRFDGQAEVVGDNHSYILLSDSSFHSMTAGWTKEVIGTGFLGADVFSSSGGKIPKDTPVVLIGEGLAVMLLVDVKLTERESDVADAVEARDAEWIAHLTPD